MKYLVIKIIKWQLIPDGAPDLRVNNSPISEPMSLEAATGKAAEYNAVMTHEPYAYAVISVEAFEYVKRTPME